MSEKILQGIRSAFTSAFNTDPATVSMDSTPADIPGWDSMGHVQLIAELENTFKISFEVEEVMEMEDVASIVRILVQKGC